MINRKLKSSLFLAGTALIALAAGAAQAQPARQPARDLQYEYSRAHPQTGDFTVIPLRPYSEVRTFDGQLITQNGVYVIRGPDGNVTVQMGNEGVLVVDAQRKELGEQLIAEIDKLKGQRPIRIFLTTNGDPERSGAGGLVRVHGEQVFGGNVAGQASDLADEAIHMSHENVLQRLSGANGRDMPVEEEMWPKESYASDTYDFYFNGEGVQLVHAPSAHTDGDSIVYFRKSDVISAGDLWDATSYPRIDTARGGSINGLLEGLTHIIDLTIPGPKQEGGTLVVPGRGRVGDESDIVEYRDMLTIIRDRIKDMADRGMTVQQVVAAKPTFDFDGTYGHATGAWTTDMFVQAVYQGVRPQGRGRAAR